MLNWIILIIVIIFLALAAESVREMHIFQVTHYLVASPKLSKLKTEKKIVLLSDLHNKQYGVNNERLLKAVKDQNPDVILIAGDMLIGKIGLSPQAAIDFVKRLPVICPVYYGNGNHEQRMKEEPHKYDDVYIEYKKELVAAGVIFLENTKAEFHMDEIPVEVRAIEYKMQLYEKFKKHIISVAEVENLIGKADDSKYQMLISHNPAFFPVLKEWGADLVVSGHLHGGIIRIPGLGGIITPQAKPFPKYSGELTMDGNCRLVISRGLGTHTINLRLFNKAEVIVIHLNDGHK